MGFRLVTSDASTGFDDGHAAVMEYTRQVTAKQRCALFMTFDDVLPDETLRSPVVIATYPETGDERAEVAVAQAVQRITESVAGMARRDRDNAGTRHDYRL